MKSFGIDHSDLTIIGLTKYSKARVQLVTKLSNGDFSESFKNLLEPLPKEKQLELLYHEAILIAVAKMIDANNQKLVTQLGSPSPNE
ncbi:MULTISPECIES: hypothetical protein [Bacillus cereus group]|uniref:hypothetical protein n=1 Tax=Bacillus cereus group TaxID=86661 RepID=UPI000BF942B4|nr:MULTISPECIES: hypothetical protein [Bacillus cereus group]PEW70496.1 hypothetical protein CN448_10425 [Bacillus cereus]